MKPTPALSRREFIRVTTLTGGGFVLSLGVAGIALAQGVNALDDTTFNAQRQALADQFCSAALTTAQAAELLWQGKLAGRSSDYLTHLPEAIVRIDRSVLLAAAQRLNQAEGGWLCLANSVTPGAPWQAAK